MKMYSQLISLVVIIHLLFTCVENTKSDGRVGSYYVLRDFETKLAMERDDLPNALTSYELLPIEEGENFVKIDIFSNLEQARKHSEQVYNSLLKISGKSEAKPGYVIYAEWKLEDKTKIDNFIQSREELFLLRQRLLVNFSFDILTKNLNADDQYLILGFYKDEVGLEQARNHPEIKAWAVDNTADHFSATDMFVPKRFTINK